MKYKNLSKKYRDMLESNGIIKKNKIKNLFFSYFVYNYLAFLYLIYILVNF